ncbi:MAG: methylmalonyl-CoA epimerase [Fidelibacterota bacterium]
MKILGIEHIGIATDDGGRTGEFWENILGLKKSGSEFIASQKIRTDIYTMSNGKVELLVPLDMSSVIQTFLDKRGPGIHHICLEVECIDEAVRELSEKNIPLVNENPITGAEGYRIIFIHPKGTGGVLVELAEKPKV